MQTAVGHSHSINMEASMIRVSVPSSHSQNQKIQQSFSDEDFVTIHADVDVDADGHYHDHDLHQNNHHPHQQQHHHPYQYPQSSTPSMETKNHLSASKTSSSTYGHQMNILSLLLSSVSILSPANNKQVFRLLDSLKTLDDENAALLREIEDTKKAQAEAKAAREAMRQFKQDYKQKFTKLKLALEKYRRENPASNNMVSNSSFMRKNRISDMQNEIQKRDKVIQKMKSESQKKDDALRKYEQFYQQKLRSE
jgi:hypothetical protein